MDVGSLFCCKECDKLVKKMDEACTCITEHRGFQLNCLETEVLDAVYHHFETKLYDGKRNADKMRYI